MRPEAFCISIPDDAEGGFSPGYRRLCHSVGTHQSTLCVQLWPAYTPDDVDDAMKRFGLRWTFPLEGTKRCPFTGLTLRAYSGRNPKARMACFLSHFHLWHDCATEGEVYIIFEDDAELIRCPTQGPTPVEGFGAVGLNDPRGATRKADVYHARTQAQTGYVVEAPWVDDDRTIPQGLAGNSAYVLHPHFAAKLVEFAQMFGAWPNDALMCKQIFPELGQLRDYATKVSGRPSTLA